jgi:3D (Asp-Asp-Asp) domain-containing protein
MRRLFAPLALLVLPLAACELPVEAMPDGPLTCSAGWFVTGYFTPVEADYRGGTETIRIPGHGNMTAYSAFLRDVEVQGWGQTLGGFYVAYYDGKWNRSASPLGASGKPIEKGHVAVDPRVVRLGSALRIRTVPTPWDTTSFRATDVGTAVAGQHVDVYTGVGAAARAEAFRITTNNAEVCHNGG